MYVNMSLGVWSVLFSVKNGKVERGRDRERESGLKVWRWERKTKRKAARYS